MGALRKQDQILTVVCCIRGENLSGFFLISVSDRFSVGLERGLLTGIYFIDYFVFQQNTLSQIMCDASSSILAFNSSLYSKHISPSVHILKFHTLFYT